MGFNRFVGWVKNFIHSRKHPAVNMMKGYGRVTLVRRAHSTNDRVERRFAQEGTKLSDTSFLRSASTRLLNKQRIGVAGANVLQIKISKYTGKACTVVPDRLIAFVDGSQHGLPGVDVWNVYRMKSGIHFNGFKFTRGNLIEFQDLTDLTVSQNVGHVKEMFVIDFPNNPSDPLVIFKVEKYVLVQSYKSILVFLVHGAREDVFVSLDDVLFLLHRVPHWDSVHLECLLRVKAVRIK